MQSTPIGGKFFNSIYPNVEFYSIQPKPVDKYKYKYKAGLNVNAVKGAHSKSGLYFADRSMIHMYLGDGTKIARVLIPDDAHVYVEFNKLKADRLIFTNVVNLDDSDLWYDIGFCNRSILISPGNLKYARIQTFELCRAALKVNPYILRYVRDKRIRMKLVILLSKNIL
jgi:hypothetical protein